MTQSVNVPGVGTLQFPDEMSQSDMAAAIQKNFPQIHNGPSAGDYVKGAGETALQMGSGLVAQPLAGLAGLGAMATHGLGLTKTDPADVVRSVQKGLTYQPKSEAGQNISNVLGYLPQKLAGAADAAGGKVTDWTGSPLLGAATNTAIQGAPLLLGAKFLPGKAAATSRAVAPEVADATSLGLKLTPEQAQSGLAGRTLQSLTGSAKLERSLSRANAPAVNQAAGADIGITQGPVTPTTVAAQKLGPNAIYNASAKAGPITLDPVFQGVVAKPMTAGTLKNSQVAELQQHYGNMTSIDAADLVADVRQLRADSAKNIKAPFAPQQNALGFAQRQISEALDAQLERHLQSINSPLAGQLPVARQQLAKIHSVQDAFDGPNISPAELAKQLDRGVPLSGNLLKIAQARQNFGRSLQDVSGLRDSGPFGALDLTLGALGGLSHPGAAAAMLARPLVRGALASAPYQRYAVQGLRTAPSRFAPGLMGSGRAFPLTSQQGLLSNEQQ